MTRTIAIAVTLLSVGAALPQWVGAAENGPPPVAGTIDSINPALHTIVVNDATFALGDTLMVNGVPAPVDTATIAPGMKVKITLGVEKNAAGGPRVVVKSIRTGGE